MHILVTGGAGFIGYHCCLALLARGDTVTLLDDFSPAPYPTALKRQNCADLTAQFGGELRVTVGDVVDLDTVMHAAAGADAVLHLAGLAGVRPSFAQPARYAAVNVQGTGNVLEAVRAHGIQRMAFASSSSVYGDSTPLPAHEDAAAIAPESPYAASKRGAELLVQAQLKSMPDVACAALRFFTVYGPRQRPEMAITQFARALLQGRPITLFGDGSMRRDFTHVDDIVRGVLAALERAPRGFRPYNLGSGQPIHLTELLVALEHASGAKAQVEHAQRPLGDVEATFADISRARDELGWQPQVEWAEGLASVIRYVRQHPDADR